MIMMYIGSPLLWKKRVCSTKEILESSNFYGGIIFEDLETFYFIRERYLFIINYYYK